MAGLAPGQPTLIGQTLGHYRIAEKIGAGGMGEVYRAQDEHLGRDVAIKVLPQGTLSDESSRKRFRKEARSFSKLNHPNIATIHDFDTQQGVDFLVMEYVPGVTLSDKVSAGPMPERQILNLGSQLAEGLVAAHDENIVHRDLKPGNLRIMPDGRLKILDFGLAKLVRPSTEAGTTASTTEGEAVAGTLPYMAPEQLRGMAVDPRTDIYATGVVLYEMATGHLPFQEKLSTALVDDILHKPSAPPGRLNPAVSPRLDQITLKCLEKEPENRYQSAKELLVDLRRLSAPMPAPMVRPRWRPAAVAAALAVFILLAVLFGLNVSGWRDRVFGTAAPQTIRSLAVLPLENMSRDPEQDYFADGMTEALITDLSKIAALRVISRTSVMQYKGVKKPLPEIARELKVDAVVEGSVLRAGDRVRITAQLIGAVPERHLWANSYDRELRDILAVHSEVAQAIAREIRIAVSSDETVRLASVRPVNPAAYDDYLKALHYASSWTGEDFKQAIEYLEAAINKDPTFAPAYAALSLAYSGLTYFGDVSPGLGYPKAKTAALRALELDDSLASAHHALSQVSWFYEWDVQAAERELKRALALDPNNAEAHLRYAMFEATVRDNRQAAMAEVSHAQELDPASASIATRIRAGWVYVFVHDYDQAMQQAREAIAIDPNYPQAYYVLGVAAIGQSKPGDAIAPLEKAMGLSRDSLLLGYLASAYAFAGQRGKAEALLNELSAQAKREYVPPLRFAMVYASLGDADSAMKWLEKSYEERTPMLWWLKVSPLYGRLHSDPRFQDLLRRIGLPR